ncbi:unnamed protein product [Danaus chrysippus]|uniref:(African queen) hypothetical protein n=1 Tax=Danaus chrysippus TaxID=151541 RepID=A0A8J2QSH4_9NEOP|nr:unnamed protein product [Danaus chrysippus]
MAQLLGGEVVEDPNNPKYYALAQESLEQYEEETGHRNLVVTVVKTATEQLDVGLIIRLVFEAKSLDQNYLLLCKSKILEPLDYMMGEPSIVDEINVDCERPLLR